MRIFTRDTCAGRKEEEEKLKTLNKGVRILAFSLISV